MFAPRVAGPQTKAADHPTRKPAPRRPAAVLRPFGAPGREAGGKHEQEAAAGSVLDRDASRGRSWSLSGISILQPDRPPAGTPQSKLAIGSVDGPLEHEAERVADQVMRMPEPGLPSGASPERLQMKPALANAGAGEAPTAVHAALRGAGRPLDSATRAFFEPRYGHSFADVRVHDDSLASRSAEALGARAYAVGRDIVFGASEYQPGSERGDRLLAHELAHVVQQSNGMNGAVVQRDAKVGNQGQPGPVAGAATKVVFAGPFNTPDSLGPIVLSKNSSKPQVTYHCDYLPPDANLEMFLSRERGGPPISGSLGTNILDGSYTFEEAVPAGTYFLRFEARSARGANIPRIKGNATLSE